MGGLPVGRIELGWVMGFNGGGLRWVMGDHSPECRYCVVVN